MLIIHKNAGRGGRYDGKDIFHVWITDDIENQKSHIAAMGGCPHETAADAYLKSRK